MSDNFNTDNKKMSYFYRHNNIFIFYSQNLKVMTPINYSSKTDQQSVSYLITKCCKFGTRQRIMMRWRMLIYTS